MDSMGPLVAIDPGTNAIGVALFKGTRLIEARTISASGQRYLRTKTIIKNLMAYLTENVPEEFNWEVEGLTVVCEEPLLRGKSNTAMQRLLGQLEFLFQAQIHYFAPTQVKKAMGAGTLDKFEVALAAGAMLETDEEQIIMADLIIKEEWDATDAVAIGLTYLRGNSR